MDNTVGAASIIGLGQMGTTLARLLLRSGWQVTVWNRTGAKAESLVKEGAVQAIDITSIVQASPVVVICVHDYKATNEIFNANGVSVALAGRVLIQLTTGSPKEASESEKWANDRGADYIDGAIQVAPEQMGLPDTTILVSGSKTAFQRSEAALNIFAGNVINLGEKVSAASTMDLATLSYVYGASLGFFHGARIIETEGLGVDVYGAIVADIAPSYGKFLHHEGNVIQSGNYSISQSPLSISVEATKRMLETAQQAGINTEFPAFAAGLLQRAAEAGYANEEVAAVVKVLREEAETASRNGLTF